MTETPKPVTFEEEVKRLEVIVSRLEEGGLPLEDNLKLFEEGQKVLQRCRTTLEEAQVRVEKLLTNGLTEALDPESVGRQG